MATRVNADSTALLWASSHYLLWLFNVLILTKYILTVPKMNLTYFFDLYLKTLFVPHLKGFQSSRC